MPEGKQMELKISLHGTVPLPDPAMARELVLELDEEATVGAAMDALTAVRPDLFPVDGARSGKLCLFAGPEQLKNPKLRLRDKLRPGLRLSVALVRPVAGG